MTTRDTNDIIMAKIMDIDEFTKLNHEIITKSLDIIFEIVKTLDARLSNLENKEVQ